MNIKADVLLNNLVPQMVLASYIVNEVFKLHGLTATITAGSDGIHLGKPVVGDTQDPHYVGKALDFRILAISPDVMPVLVADLKTSLGPLFVVIQESNHIHVQYGHIA